MEVVKMRILIHKERLCVFALSLGICCYFGVHYWMAWINSTEKTPMRNAVQKFHTQREFSNLSNNVCKHATQYQVAETVKDKLLIYNMVPKTASEAFRAVMKKLAPQLNYNTSEGNYSIYEYHIATLHHTRDVLMELVNDEILSVNLSFQGHIYHKHIHFIDFKSLFGIPTPNYLNIIRDPIDHYISWYYYRRFHKWGGLLGPLHLFQVHKEFMLSEEGQKLKNLTFDECVQSRHEECVNPLYMFRVLPIFCGHDDSCLQPTRKTLLKAMRNVVNHYPVVGYMENLPQFYEMIEFMWPQFFTGVQKTYSEVKMNKTLSNISKWRGGDLEPNDKTRDIMARRMSLDYEFYKWIKQRFHCMYEYYVKRVN